MKRLSGAALLAVGLATSSFAQRPLTTYVYPLARPIPSPRVVLDDSELPSQRAWGLAAKRLVEEWYPILTQLLATERYRSPREIRLVLKPTMDAPAATEGAVMSINGEWIQQHPDDLGMMIHELTHVIQAYPDYPTKPGWLVEGIADYIRWWRYEPEAPRPRVNPAKDHYDDAYRTTAAWLAWVSRRYYMGLVPALDRAIRAKQDPLPLFLRFTGHSAEELWTEYVHAAG